MTQTPPKHIAVIGSGIAGLSAAWLLSKAHSVTLFEKDDRFGGHSNTVVAKTAAGTVPVDTGFIVYNPKNYPNLTALFDHIGVQTSATDMSFGVSAEGGAIEYNGNGLKGIFASASNCFNPKIWRMLLDILRFYRESPTWHQTLSEEITLGQLLAQQGFSDALRDLHLIPMGAAIWSTPKEEMLQYPALSFIRFCDNHGLLQVKDRPQWRTVVGGSREYVRKLVAQIQPSAFCNLGVRQVIRHAKGVEVVDARGDHRQFDAVVLACHADQALQLLSQPSEQEQQLLGAFRYQRNRAILHSDTRLLPKNQKVWSSWNYLSGYGEHADSLAVSYWMNQLQPLATTQPLIVTLNPPIEPDEALIHSSFLYDHPLFNQHALAAQQQLYQLQGQQNTWFCGSYFGYGFHEDGLQSGLAVAEALGAPQRPWQVANPSGRIHWPQSTAQVEQNPVS